MPNQPRGQHVHPGGSMARAVDCVVRNAYVITLDRERRVFADGFVAFTGGRLTEVGRMAEGPHRHRKSSTLEAGWSYPVLSTLTTICCRCAFVATTRSTRLDDRGPGLHGSPTSSHRSGCRFRFPSTRPAAGRSTPVTTQVPATSCLVHGESRRRMVWRPQREPFP